MTNFVYSLIHFVLCSCAYTLENRDLREVGRQGPCRPDDMTCSSYGLRTHAPLTKTSFFMRFGVQCCLMSTETVQSTVDWEPWAATLTFTQLLLPSWCFTSTETIRLIRDGRRCGKREIIYLSLHCHHQNDSCIKMGSSRSHFNVSLIVRGKMRRLSTDHDLFEEKGEPKRNRSESFCSFAASLPWRWSCERLGWDRWGCERWGFERWGCSVAAGGICLATRVTDRGPSPEA